MTRPGVVVAGAAAFAAFGAGVALATARGGARGDPWVEGRLLTVAIDSVRANALDEVPGDELIRRAVAGMLRELGDPYATVLDTAQVRRYRGAQRGDGVGLGLTLRRVGSATWVTHVHRGSPAALAGVRPGDRLLTRAGGPLAADAVASPDGDAAPPHRWLAVRAAGRDTVPVTVAGGRWRQPAVREVALLDAGVGYVQLQAVLADAADEVERAVASLAGRGATSLVLDLRGNVGGLFDEGVRVASLFLPRGTLVASLSGRDGRAPQEYRARRSRFDELPVVVLVDGRTASAAELVAAALREQRASPLVGATTFGKGVVQRVVRLSPELSMRLTTARWLTPSGAVLQRVPGVTGGLVPDVAVDTVARPELFAVPASWSAPAARRADRMADSLVRAALRSGWEALPADSLVLRMAALLEPARSPRGVRRGEYREVTVRLASARLLGRTADGARLAPLLLRYDPALRAAAALARDGAGQPGGDAGAHGPHASGGRP